MPTATTSNGAITNVTSGSALLDLFAISGSARTHTGQALKPMLAKAAEENATLALKLIAYTRDARGGRGERVTGRNLLREMATLLPELVRKNLEHFPEYGRWDDLIEALEGTPLEKDAYAVLSKQLKQDLATPADKPISLVGKWAPSINASSVKTRGQANKLRATLGMTPKQYRQNLSTLRKRLDVIERKMTSQAWSEIEYEHVPSNAAMSYRKAFKRHDAERYAKYLEDVKSGKATIKAGVLFPYEITSRILSGPDATLEAQWKALPDYLADNPHKAIVVCDSSSSMHGSGLSSVRPIDVAISLSVYMAERTVGLGKNRFITFNTKPELLELKGDSLYEKVRFLYEAPWGGHTNLQSSFDLLLDNRVLGDIPDVVYIVSDMQFNKASPTDSNYTVIKQRFTAAGVTCPKLIFWNVNAALGNNPITMLDDGCCMVSGASPTVFKSILANKPLDPYSLMLDTLNVERYARLKA